MTNLIENNIYDKSLLNLYLAGFYHILMQYLNLFPVRMLHIPADTRSAFPVISVHSPVSIQYRWQS